MNNKKAQKKYVSVRKALRELRVDEGGLKKIIKEGGIKVYPEGDSKVKFDADEIEKYRTSQVQRQEDQPDIADENLYESADVSFDSLFKTQMGGGNKGGMSITEEIPQEPGLASDVPFQKQNVQEFLSKKKAKPISPIKAIHGGKSNVKSTQPTIFYALFFLIVIIASVNSYLLLQVNTEIIQIKTSKVISDELEPQITVLSTVVSDSSQSILSPVDGIVKEIYTRKNKEDKLFVIENANKNQLREKMLHLEQSLLQLKLEQYKLQKQPKIQQQVQLISEIYSKNRASISQTNPNAWLQNIELQIKNKKYDQKAIFYWLQLQTAQSRYKKAQIEWEKVEKQFAANVAIKAPFQGEVTNVYVKKNNRVNSGDILAEYSTKTTVIEAQISRKELSQITLDKSVTIALPNGDEEKGEIARIVPKQDFAHVYVRTKTPLSIGVKPRITFFLQKIPECILVPKKAIFFQTDIRGNHQAMVCKVIKKKEKKQVFPIPVVIGKYDDDFVQVLTGIDPGDSVITGGTRPLQSFVYEQYISK